MTQWFVPGDTIVLFNKKYDVPFSSLESGDRTVAVGEGGLEMGEDVRRRSVFRRQLGRRAPLEECGAGLALAVVEPLPDALPGPVAQMTNRQHAAHTAIRAR
jgi:hypothetical protein